MCRAISTCPCIVILLCACGHGRASLPGEEALERGGELAEVHAERQPVTVTSSTITVWGMTEVPDGSRMQMAEAGVDAITRSELIKAVEVRVVSVVTDSDSSAPDRRSISDEVVEIVDGRVGRGHPLAHGWARVRRNGEVVLRIWARLELPRAEVESAVRSLLQKRGKPYPASFLEGLGAPSSRIATKDSP